MLLNSVTRLLILLSIFHFCVGESDPYENGHTENEERAPAEPLTPQDYQNAEAINDMKVPPTTNTTKDPIEIAGLFEGDINVSKNKEPQKNAIVQETKKWPGAVVPYLISADFTDKERSIIARAFMEYHRHTCIKFRARSSESDYVHITKGNGCSSPVGRVGGAQQVTLGDGCVYPGIAIHELMHAIGFWHEQSRADRDQFVTIHWNNIQEGMQQNFKSYKWGDIQNLTAPYNTSSIMHYGPYAFARNRAERTITPKDTNTEMGQRNNFSDTDLFKIRKLYDCGSHSAPTSTSTSTTTGTGSCVDLHQHCSKWAEKDECKKNPKWMLVNCKKSCNACNEECSDSNRNCPAWATRGECTKNPDYMRSYCSKSCSVCVDCQDTEEHCEYWASKGECSKNPDFMNKNCPKSCKKCGNTGSASDTDCEDKNQHCEYWASNGECTKNPDYMKKQCAKSCKACNSGSDTDCEDNNENCAYWASKGECSKNPSYMNANCQKSCDSCRINEECRDKSSNCPAWADKGECDKNPNYMHENCPKSCKICRGKETSS